MKKPVVSLDNGGTPEVVEHGRNRAVLAPSGRHPGARRRHRHAPSRSRAPQADGGLRTRAGSRLFQRATNGARRRRRLRGDPEQMTGDPPSGRVTTFRGVLRRGLADSATGFHDDAGHSSLARRCSPARPVLPRRRCRRMISERFGSRSRRKGTPSFATSSRRTRSSTFDPECSKKFQPRATLQPLLRRWQHQRATNSFPGEESRPAYEALREYGVLDLIREISPTSVREPYVGCNLNLPGSVAQHYHADSNYFTEDFMVANVAVVDTDLRNGAIDVVPKTHKKYYKYWRFAVERPYRFAKRIPMQQGDVLVRTSNLWHRGMPNRADIAAPDARGSTWGARRELDVGRPVRGRRREDRLQAELVPAHSPRPIARANLRDGTDHLFRVPHRQFARRRQTVQPLIPGCVRGATSANAWSTRRSQPPTRTSTGRRSPR